MEAEWGTVIHVIGSHVMINTSARLQLRAVVIETIKERRKKSPLLMLAGVEFLVEPTSSGDA